MKIVCGYLAILDDGSVGRICAIEPPWIKVELAEHIAYVRLEHIRASRPAAESTGKGYSPRVAKVESPEPDDS